jgi:hypothetical protein
MQGNSQEEKVAKPGQIWPDGWFLFFSVQSPPHGAIADFVPHTNLAFYGGYTQVIGRAIGVATFDFFPKG